MPTCTALIVAGGRGSRFGGPLPKQYATLAGQPVLRRTLGVFQATPGIDRLQVVVASGDEGLYRAAVEGMDLPPPVAGGVSRQQSVLNGLEALAAHAPDLVAIHDAARPYVRVSDIIGCLEALRPGIDGAVLGVPVADTLKKVDEAGLVAGTVRGEQCGEAEDLRCLDPPKAGARHRAGKQPGLVNLLQGAGRRHPEEG